MTDDLDALRDALDDAARRQRDLIRSATRRPDLIVRPKVRVRCHCGRVLVNRVVPFVPTPDGLLAPVDPGQIIEVSSCIPHLTRFGKSPDDLDDPEAAALARRQAGKRGPKADKRATYQRLAFEEPETKKLKAFPAFCPTDGWRIIPASVVMCSLNDEPGNFRWVVGASGKLVRQP
jgi:hypothetical protein